MEDIFHLKVPFDKRCHLAALYQVTEAPCIVAVSVFNKMTRDKSLDNLIQFIQTVKAENTNAPPKLTEEQKEEERKQAEKAAKASERAAAFLKNRNNAQVQAAAM